MSKGNAAVVVRAGNPCDAAALGNPHRYELASPGAGETPPERISIEDAEDVVALARVIAQQIDLTGAMASMPHDYLVEFAHGVVEAAADKGATVERDDLLREMVREHQHLLPPGGTD